MKKHNAVFLDDILKHELKDKSFKLLFDEHRFYLEIARLISELRFRSGLSQQALAKKTGVSQPLIARLEKGDKQRTPTIETIFKVLRCLGYHLELRAIPDRKSVA